LDERVPRACVVAPRDHCKSEIFAVSLPSFKTLYTPNHWTQIFSLTSPLAEELMERCVKTMEKAELADLRNPKRWNTKDKILKNGARITATGVGGSVRGGHPDLIICDDILDESNSGTDYQRKKLQRWFTEVVSPMAKPETRIIVVGTPQHQLDLLMGFLRHNPEYMWIQYPAEIKAEVYELYKSGQVLEMSVEKLLKAA